MLETSPYLLRRRRPLSLGIFLDRSSQGAVRAKCASISMRLRQRFYSTDQPTNRASPQGQVIQAKQKRMKETIQQLDEGLLNTLLDYLDPFAKYQLGISTRGADLELTNAIASSLLSQVLPSNIVPVNPRDIFTEHVAISIEESWKRKEGLVDNLLTSPPTNDAYQTSRYDKNALSSGDGRYLSALEQLLISKPWKVFDGDDEVNFDRKRANVIHRLVVHAANTARDVAISHACCSRITLQDVQFACERYMNLRTSYGPAEKTFDVPYLQDLCLRKFSFAGKLTLNEIATLRFLSREGPRQKSFYEMVEEHNNGVPVQLDSWEAEWPSYQDQVQSAGVKMTYLRQRIRDILAGGSGKVVVNKEKWHDDGHDPYDTLEQGASDGDWEDWLASLPDVPWEERSEDEIKAILERMKQGLDELLQELISMMDASNEDYDSKKTTEHYQYKLDRQEFFEIFEWSQRGLHTLIPCSPSATAYVQGAVEDFVFGCAVKPFLVTHPSVEGNLRCNVVIGEQGITVFSLDDNTDDSDDDDSDYEPMEEE